MMANEAEVMVWRIRGYKLVKKKLFGEARSKQNKTKENAHLQVKGGRNRLEGAAIGWRSNVKA